MNIIDIRRRLGRIESARHVGAPTSVMADYPIEDDEADAALANWRVRVAQGRASALDGVHYLIKRTEMSEAEWADRYATEQ